MHIFLCLDDRNGISFNGRRLSSDCVVCQQITETAQGKLWMNSSSAKLFAGYSVCVDEDFLAKAGMADSCFMESTEFMDTMSKVTYITVYRWNRHYPSDVKLSDSVLNGWKLVLRREFSGNSHDVITEERYER